MSRILAAIIKEYLILSRDKAGLALIFLMPVALIIVVTLIQDTTFRTLKETGVPLIFVDYDNDSLGKSIENGLNRSKFFFVEKTLDGKPATLESARKSVAEGKYQLGIVVPKNATLMMKSKVQGLVSANLPGMNAIKKSKNFLHDSVKITVFIDPAIKTSFKNSIMSALGEYTSKIESRIIYKTFNEEVRKLFPVSSAKPQELELSEFITIDESYASAGNFEKTPNSVQHNVPAWTLFAMFFIVIPLGSSLIKEREEGSHFRIMTMPGSPIIFILGKAAIFFMICMIQFVLMILVGIYLMPLLDLPLLELGNDYLPLIIAAVCSSLAAVGYGILIGTIAKTQEQSSVFGSISVIILAAIGGIWVPVYVMPSIMRKLSVISPMNWGLNSFYEIFLRSGSLSSIFPDITKLILFFILTITAAFLYRKRILRV